MSHPATAILVVLAALVIRADEPPIVERLQAEAKTLRPQVETPLARAFLEATATLPAGEARVVFRDENGYYSVADTLRLTPEKRDALERVEFDEGTYYTTKYGSPLAYVRALELAGRAGLDSVDGVRVVDFGYGTVGHLRLLGSLGADARGVDIDTLLPALYSRPEDQGPIGRGRVTLVDGRWPATTSVREAVGDGISLFMSKNTLKHGYIHPARPVDEKRLVHLGVSDEVFCRAVHEALVPGGLFLIYNLSPAPAPPDEPYKPWADGRCPFDRALLEKIGFEIIAFDADDGPAARSMARALGWDRGPNPMDLEHDLFAHHTLLRRP